MTSSAKWLIASLLLAVCSHAAAQNIQPTPEMRELLNQLPPSQREAALRQLQGQSTTNLPVQSIAGNDDESSDASSAELIDALENMSEPPRFAPGDTLVLQANGSEGTEELVARIRENNPFAIDSDGDLNIPGISSIPLAGLSEEQAKIRLEAEPALAGVSFAVVLLPVAPTGEGALRPYGYDLFTNSAARATAEMSMPVPGGYTIGPGDAVRAQLFGAENASYELFVERDGTILFPELGPLTVAGMTFEQLREFLQQRVSEQLIGTQVSVSMGTLRSVQVFLVGDVNAPGSYTVGALSTMTTVLAVGGGVSENGSLRRIELKRDGSTVNVLDVYDLLLRGNSTADLRVLPGDVVFVPPVGTRVSIAGEVRRPGIYEYRGAANVADVIGLAGGVSARAFGAGTSIERLNDGESMVTVEANLDEPAGRETLIRDGDVVVVPGVLDRVEQSVELLGSAERPGTYQWREGLRLSDVLVGPQSVKPGSDLGYVLIRRESESGAPEFLSANVSAAWRLRGSPVDLTLHSGDRIHVFDLEAGRGQFIGALLEEASLYTDSARPSPIVSIAGSVNSPGRFPLEQGMRIADLLRAGGGLSQSAYTREAELTRYDVSGGERNASILTIDIEAALAGEPAANIDLQAFDYLIIREIPQWREEEYVELVGEFAFPGRYPIRRGETLSSVIVRAGGLTDLAFVDGNVFTREELREREREQLADLAERVESDLANIRLSDPTQVEGIGAGQALLQQLRNTEPVGRLVIDLDDVLRGDNDVALRGGDVLRVPQTSQSVTVIGEVQYSTSHLFDDSLDRDDYIERSGGMTSNADKRRTYVVRADGEVVSSSGSRFLVRQNRQDIQPGDTIVVPLNTDRVQPLTLWTGITQVLYNVAIAAAAVQSFD